MQSRIDRRRWVRGSQEWKDRLLDRAHEYVRDTQVESIPNATARGSRWTQEEEAQLMENRDVPIRTVAADLGRTYYGVRARLNVLRERGLID